MLRLFSQLIYYHVLTYLYLNFDFHFIVSVMELVAMHLKRQGAYLCRTLSFEGCVFHTVSDAISDEQVQIYDEAARFWQELLMALLNGIADGSLRYPLKKPARGLDSDDDDDEDDEEVEDDIGNKDALRVTDEANAQQIVMRYFWGAHQVYTTSLTHYYMYISFLIVQMIISPVVFQYLICHVLSRDSSAI